MSSAEPTYREIDRTVVETLAPPSLRYWLWVASLAALVALGIALWTNQIYSGLTVTGLRQPTMWAVYITNFVFWVGIAHSGTLISAILFLFRTRWRTPVYRAAETMTVFAVLTAGLFPVIHLGRPWFFYWLLPYPNERWLQPNFRSPLVWDTFAVGTYFTVSGLFLLMGMLPDLATARTETAGWRKSFYRLMSLGWRGTETDWQHFSMAYLLLAGLATPLVVSVHSVVSWDFAMAQQPGWHSTIFAPYFVAGAIFSGCAMVMTLMVPTRRLLGLERLLTPWHFDNLCKVTLLTSLIVSYAYLSETFMAWYSADPIEIQTFQMRYWGPWGPLFWLTVFCNCVVPLVFFSPRVRTNTVAVFVVSIFINIGMWTERLVIIPGSLTANFMPSQWALFHPSWTEIGITVASFAWFLMWFSLFTRFLPIVSMTEVKEGVGWLRQALREKRAA